MSARKRWFQKLGFWSNRANDAYNMGEADWAGNGSVCDYAVRRLRLFRCPADCNRCDQCTWAAYMAYKAVERICKVRGVDSERHRFHAR